MCCHSLFTSATQEEQTTKSTATTNCTCICTQRDWLMFILSTHWHAIQTHLLIVLMYVIHKPAWCRSWSNRWRKPGMLREGTGSPWWTCPCQPYQTAGSPCHDRMPKKNSKHGFAAAAAAPTVKIQRTQQLSAGNSWQKPQLPGHGSWGTNIAAAHAILALCFVEPKASP